ncbi:hypothetical protein M8C21_006611 [Ambrosia artemisiifolia]|uniref:Uncharacterized protein n=1 Tax=Ambrosia artemisiifolia TaxID=4212 RepID=A0AAD5CRW2_AMBAR|nr:hypothetical protein M8C21_006611 [Ambrosia artemisiifolia]
MEDHDHTLWPSFVLKQIKIQKKALTEVMTGEDANGRNWVGTDKLPGDASSEKSMH